MNPKLLVRDAHGHLVACADEVQAVQVRQGAAYRRVQERVEKIAPQPELDPSSN